MVNVQKGILVECDPAMKQFLLHLDEENSLGRKFVIQDLDETHIFISADILDTLQERIDDLMNKISFPVTQLELNNLLNFDEKNPPNGQTILVTESSAEGTFVIHHLVSLYLKGGYNVCLVSFAHSFNHYSNVAAKFGIKLNTARDSGNFAFLGGLDALGKGILERCNGRSDSTSAVSLQQILEPISNNDCTKSLCEAIETTYKSLKDCHIIPSLLIIDDLSLPVHLGVPSLDLVWLMQYLQKFICGTPQGKGCLTSLVHRDIEEEDEDINFLTKSLQHRCDLHLNVTGLPSGYSKEVHGQLQIRWNNAELHDTTISNSKTAQFKIGDKNVAFFAKGMSSAVL